MSKLNFKITSTVISDTSIYCDAADIRAAADHLRALYPGAVIGYLQGCGWCHSGSLHGNYLDCGCGGTQSLGRDALVYVDLTADMDS